MSGVGLRKNALCFPYPSFLALSTFKPISANFNIWTNGERYFCDLFMIVLSPEFVTKKAFNTLGWPPFWTHWSPIQEMEFVEVYKYQLTSGSKP